MFRITNDPQLMEIFSMLESRFKYITMYKLKNKHVSFCLFRDCQTPGSQHTNFSYKNKYQIERIYGAFNVRNKTSSY